VRLGAATKGDEELVRKSRLNDASRPFGSEAEGRRRSWAIANGINNASRGCRCPK
jgi:hypothetical protein